MDTQAHWCLGLVDDDALTLMALSALIKSNLSDNGISVAWAARSGDEAVDKCIERTTCPSAVLVDMGMDVVDGAMTMRRIRRVSARIMLLAMTSHSLAKYRDTARSSGAWELLDKADFPGLARCLLDYATGRRTGIPSQHAVIAPEISTCSLAKPSLSIREIEVMDWTIEGLTAKEVATKMSVSESTVKTHIRHVISKLQARNKLHAMSLWSEIRRKG